MEHLISNSLFSNVHCKQDHEDLSDIFSAKKKAFCGSLFLRGSLRLDTYDPTDSETGDAFKLGLLPIAIT
jgi:hypothetical protein